MKYSSALLLFIFLVLVSCLTISDRNLNNQAILYQQSIVNAMSPDSAKICTNLVPVNHQNNNLIWKTINGVDYLLVVTWKQNISYYKPYLDSAFFNTGGYPIWITTAPELKNRMKQSRENDINLRLKELLGLPPNSVYSYFVEFWVKPEDLFRPCPDKEITDNRCDLCFPENSDSTHINWINTNRIDRYYPCNLYNKYPWTQLGYTYDWNPKNRSHIGLSEFVIGAHKNIVVNAIYTTEEYLKGK
jgi:hypothetical protein